MMWCMWIKTRCAIAASNSCLVAACTQLWRFQPWVQKAVNASLRELKGLNNPTVAFHVRGGDLSADLQANVTIDADEPVKKGCLDESLP